MARAFASTTDRIRNASAPTVTPAGSIFLRIKPTWSSGDGAIHTLWARGETGGLDEPSFQKYADNNIYIGFYTGAEQRIVIADTGIFVSGTWASHLFTWDDTADTEYYYVDNVEKGNRTSTLTPSLGTGRTIGNYPPANGDANAAADLAEYGEWNRTLDAAERAVLQATGCPLSVPRGLVSHLALIGRYSPEVDPVGGGDHTVTGATTSPHPRVILPRRRPVFPRAAAASTRGLHHILHHVAGIG